MSTRQSVCRTYGNPRDSFQSTFGADRHCLIPLVEVPQAVDVTESESTLVGARDAGWGGSGESVFRGDKSSVSEGETFGRWTMEICTTV